MANLQEAGLQIVAGAQQISFSAVSFQISGEEGPAIAHPDAQDERPTIGAAPNERICRHPG